MESAYRTLHASYSTEQKTEKQGVDYHESGKVEEYDIKVMFHHHLLHFSVFRDNFFRSMMYALFVFYMPTVLIHC